MRSYKAENGTSFLCNSDLSGDILITLPNGVEVVISGADLLELAADVVRFARISALELATVHETLGMK